MQSYPKISIITPNYNGGKYLEETILSVLSQGYPNLEYIIMDGGSTDNSLDIIKKYESQLYYWESQPDKGMYDALNKGFAKSTGEIMGWINSDDMLHYKSLFYLESVFNTHKNQDWFTGVTNMRNEAGFITKVFLQGHNSSKYYYYANYYLNPTATKFGYHGVIQQESTYWRRSLWEKAGGYIDNTLKYAGDFELWIRFFRYSNLACVRGLIGSFRILKADQQLSRKFLGQYIAETQKVIANEVVNINSKDKKKISRLKFYYKYIRNKIPLVTRVDFINRFFKQEILKPVIFEV